MQLPYLSSLNRLAAASCAALLVACGSPPTVELPELASLRASLPIADAQAERGEGPPDWVNSPREDDEFVYGLGIVPVSRSSHESLYRALGEARYHVLEHLHNAGAKAASPGHLGPPLELDEDAVVYQHIYFDETSRTWYALGRLDREKLAKSIRRELEALDELATSDVQELEGGDDSVALALRLLFTLDRRDQLASQLIALGESAPKRPTDRGKITGTMRAHDALSRKPFRIDVDAPVPHLYEDVRGALAEFAIETAEFGSVDHHFVSIHLVEHGVWSRNARYLSVDGSMELALGAGPTRTIPIRAVGSGRSASEARERAVRVARTEVVEALRAALVEEGRAGSASALR